MSNNTTETNTLQRYEAIQDEVAVEFGFESWDHVPFEREHDLIRFIVFRFAESERKLIWSEACEAQKKVCLGSVECEEPYAHIIPESILNAPNAPYPNDKP